MTDLNGTLTRWTVFQRAGCLTTGEVRAHDVVSGMIAALAAAVNGMAGLDLTEAPVRVVLEVVEESEGATL